MHTTARSTLRVKSAKDLLSQLRCRVKVIGGCYTLLQRAAHRGIRRLIWFSPRLSYQTGGDQPCMHLLHTGSSRAYPTVARKDSECSSNVGPRRIDNHIIVDYAPSAATFLHYPTVRGPNDRVRKVSASKLAAARESGGHEAAISR